MLRTRAHTPWKWILFSLVILSPVALFFQNCGKPFEATAHHQQVPSIVNSSGTVPSEVNPLPAPTLAPVPNPLPTPAPAPIPVTKMTLVKTISSSSGPRILDGYLYYSNYYDIVPDGAVVSLHRLNLDNLYETSSIDLTPYFGSLTTNRVINIIHNIIRFRNKAGTISMGYDYSGFPTLTPTSKNPLLANFPYCNASASSGTSPGILFYEHCYETPTSGAISTDTGVNDPKFAVGGISPEKTSKMIVFMGPARGFYGDINDFNEIRVYDWNRTTGAVTLISKLDHSGQFGKGTISDSGDIFIADNLGIARYSLSATHQLSFIERHDVTVADLRSEIGSGLAYLHAFKSKSGVSYLAYKLRSQFHLIKYP